MGAIIRQHFGQLFNGHDYGRVIKHWLGRHLRRLLNFLGAALGLFLLSPFFLFVATIIKLDSPGPLFYWGPRVGKNGRPFGILKFRTMYDQTESYHGPRITGKGDRRITAVGQWLRDTKLNELPQLWNVLIGDMSFVGPRPEDPAYVKHWPEEKRHLLLSVRPGITSPASIAYRDEEKLLQAKDVEEEYLGKILPDKLRLDLLYLRHRSILGDLDIIFWTVVVLIPLLRKQRIPDHLLFWGPGARFVDRYFSWFFMDALVAFTAVATMGLLWRSAGPLDVGLNISILLALLVALVFSFANFVFGLGRIMWSKANSGYVLFLFASAMLATVVLLLANQLLPTPLPSNMLIGVGILAWLGFVVVRYRLRLLSGAAQHWLNIRPQTTFIGERVLIVGAGVVGRFAATLLNDRELLPTFTVVGVVDDNLRKGGAQIGDLHVLGTTADISPLVQKYDINIIVFAISELPDRDQMRILAHCNQSAARVVFLPDIVHDLKSKFMNAQELDCPPAMPLNQLQGLLDEVDTLVQEEQIMQARERISFIRSQIAQADVTQITAH
ncbi:MAG: hypothetical protein GWP61_03860 [Chloroflexi bacterium]|jgi:lipopolysaccharide/colanic/teichoic acid biosynthesis glycosyltransferase|nr:hypothetical protein [Chloroflexota bacterium]